MKSYQNIIFDLNNQIATLTINNPASLNALNQATLEEIDDAIQSLESGDVQARVLIITGAGEKSFVAGADIKEMATINMLAARAFSKLGNRVFMAIDKLSIPTIAAINGYALGGGLELAMACDLRFAATHAIAGLPEVNLGVIPGFGGTQRLSRIVGPSKAMELMFSASNLKAEEAYRIGLFNRLIDPVDLMPETFKYAQKVASKGPIAVKFVKQAVKSGYEMSLEQAVALESELFGSIFSTKDQVEGMAAFIEKRPAEFKNQ